VLDRALAQEQLYPAIDVHRTGTRKEERLYSASEMAHLAALRRTLADYPSRQALTHLLKLLAQYPTNTKLLRHFTTRINPRAGY
jgi:transcription termination factor Rho